MTDDQGVSSPLVAHAHIRNLLLGSSFFIFILWSIGSFQSIWFPQSELIVMPVKVELFDLIPALFSGSRIVIPSFLAPLFLYLLSMLGPVSLMALLWTGFYFFPGPPFFRFAMALGLVAACYSSGAPGESPLFVMELSYILLLLGVFVRPSPNAFSVFFVSSLALVFSLMTGLHSFTLYWLTSAAILSSSLHFLFVDKWHIPVRLRRLGRGPALQMLGFCLLGSAILVSSFQTQGFVEKFVPSESFLVPFLGVLFCMTLSFLRPWESQRWLRLGIATLGTLLSQEFLFPQSLLVGWLALELLITASRNPLLQAKLLQVPRLLWTSSYVSLLVFLFLSMIIQVTQYRPQRNISWDWGEPLKALQSQKMNDGVLIFGNALGFLSTFYPGPIVSGAPVLLESSEEKLWGWLGERGLQHIFVDRHTLQERWLEFLDEGVDPTKLNESVISRLLLYQGQSLETKTLALEPIQLFKIHELDSKRIVWIERLREQDELE